ncbi:glycoside hydrolase family 65 protein [Actinacidiphila sp. DG2A-62]|uniref:glycoside hydrolase family 65 protein n=1 Tax=Actinacidiphila sp. DG2A-62 TaxID=3108821 RepID=UPI002DB5F60A|nr:glycoside hydrolase family 65 protein [Actinacidiphila sp. DG2A-62]MEC3992324.1 glycoside hydrolase family 65 protein [Actinacidiphila sp. DG2A-62]
MAPHTTAAATAAGDWTWRYDGYAPGEERLREALCTLGNGYTATRGAWSQAVADDTHYPGTYVAGCYNRLTSRVAGREVENEDIVNLPNWLPLRVRAAGGDWFGPDTCAVLAHEQILDLRRGTLTRRCRLRDAAGREVAVEETRLVHMGDPHLAAQRVRITAEGWSGDLEVESGLDGDVANAGVARYRDLAGRHLTGHRTGADGDTVWLDCRTSASGIRIAQAARTRVAGAARAAGPAGPPGTDPADAGPPDADPLNADPTGTDPPDAGPRAGSPAPPHSARTVLEDRAAYRRLTLPVAAGRPVTVEKTVTLHTSRDPGGGDPLAAAREGVARAPDVEALLASHAAAWRELWRRAPLRAPGEAGRVLRLHLFHVLQTLSPHTADLDVGVPARGLHGEAYRGHVFWDELFVLPYLDAHLPEVSRGLLRYRHRRLGAACRAAEEAGGRGAMYPWQSGSDGREETQALHLNPRSGRWLPDYSRLQHHVGSAVAYNMWRYAATSGDTAFLYGEGADTILRIARFWAHRAAWDPAHGRYRITGVVGPDEYHERYPGAARPGLDDNAYTNVTAAWVLARALELVEALPAARRAELLGRLALDRAELARWDEVSRRLRVPRHAGVISQFDGYGELAELDWAAYRRRYGDIRRMDRVLEAEGDDVNRYQVSKQADVLMLGYLFEPAELRGLFDRLGERLDEAVWTATVDHYLARTSHGSTLSGLVHGWVLARSRRAEAWTYLREALLGDVADLQGGTTGEGIHLGVMGGTLDLVRRGLPLPPPDHPGPPPDHPGPPPDRDRPGPPPDRDRPGPPPDRDRPDAS